MNRLRHAYLLLAPELEGYFTTGHHDDHASILQSYGLGYRLSFGRVLGGTPALVGAIDVVLAGADAALLAETLGASGSASRHRCIIGTQIYGRPFVSCLGWKAKG